MNLGSQHSGSKGNLYYYDSTGKLIFRGAGEIGADGNISLSFSHASEYVVIIDKASLESGDKDDNSDDGQDDDGQDDDSQEGGSQDDDGQEGGGQDSGSQKEISIAKMDSNVVPKTDVKNDNDSGKPKSPKTGE